MKNKIIKLIASGTGTLKVAGFDDSTVPLSSIERLKVSILTYAKDLNPDTEIEALARTKNVYIPEDATAYEIADQIPLGDVKVYAVVFYKGISLKVEVGTTNIRHERYEQK